MGKGACDDGMGPEPLSVKSGELFQRLARTTRAIKNTLLDQSVLALLSAMPEAKRHPEMDTEFWLHNELTWVRWQQGDLDKALTEVEASGVTLDHGTLPESRKAALRLHTLWDRDPGTGTYLTLTILDLALLAAAAKAAGTVRIGGIPS